MPFPQRTYRLKDGARIDEVSILAFIHNVDFYLTEISVYQDGMIDCWGLVDLDGFAQKVRSGWVRTHAPEGARVIVSLLGSFNATNAAFPVEPEEFIKEVADEIEELNGRPTTSSRCRETWHDYQQDPSEARKEALRAAYLAIPKHNEPNPIFKTFLRLLSSLTCQRSRRGVQEGRKLCSPALRQTAAKEPHPGRVNPV